MPVSFYVDPAILEDPEGRYVREITLGYTFYEIDLPEEEAHAALDPVPGPVPASGPASGGPLTADGQASID
jgi:cytochrome c oxidase assembly protein subunit 11